MQSPPPASDARTNSPTPRDLPAAAVGQVYSDRPPVPRHLDPAAALAYRTSLWEHTHNADNKAAGLLTLLGIMFTLLARFGAALGDTLSPARENAAGGGAAGVMRVAGMLLLGGFAALAFATVIQAFRTISPRFPKAPPSLAFFGDIARLSREQYVARVESMTPDEALEQMLSYNHTGSTICVAKFRELRRCFKCFQVAVAFWLPLMALVVARALA